MNERTLCFPKEGRQYKNLGRKRGRRRRSRHERLLVSILSSVALTWLCVISPTGALNNNSCPYWKTVMLRYYTHSTNQPTNHNVNSSFIPLRMYRTSRVRSSGWWLSTSSSLVAGGCTRLPVILCQVTTVGSCPADKSTTIERTARNPRRRQETKKR